MSGHRTDIALLRETFTDDRIAALVEDFYGRVQGDDLLGPVFAAHVQSWDVHLARMTTFWGSIMRAETGYQSSEKGTPLQIHARLAEIDPRHFARWLSLFDTTTSDHFPEWAAQNIMRRARRMAVTLSAHLPQESID